MPHRLRRSGRVCRIDCGIPAVYGTWIAEFRPYNRMYCESSAVYATWTAEPRRG